MLEFLRTKDFRIGFITGVCLHFLMLYRFVKVFQFKCVEGGCGNIIVFDIPLSLLYFAFPDGFLIVCSAIFGSFLWGLWFAFLLRMVQSFFGSK